MIYGGQNLQAVSGSFYEDLSVKKFGGRGCTCRYSAFLIKGFSLITRPVQVM